MYLFSHQRLADVSAHRYGRKVIFGLFVVQVLGACSQTSLVKPPGNMIVLHQDGDKNLSCQQLDREINTLHGKAQRLAPPDFSEDSSNAAAAVAGTFVFSPAYLYILRNELMDKPKQRMRITAVIERIELLRRYKAEKHCYESR